MDNGDLASAGTRDKQNRDKNREKDSNKKGMKEGEGENVKGDKDRGGHTNDGYIDVDDNGSNNYNNNNNSNNKVSKFCVVNVIMFFFLLGALRLVVEALLIERRFSLKR